MASTGFSSFKIVTVFRGGPIRWLALGGMFLIAAIAIGATVMAGNFRDRALRNSEHELENTVLLLARHFDQQLADFEVVQKDLIAFIRSSGLDTAENYKRRMSTQEINLMLKSKMDALSYVGGIAIFDADGRLINTSAAWPVPSVNSADRNYLLRALGCSEMQGYLFSAPKPAAEIKPLLSAHRQGPDEDALPSRARKRKPVARTA